MMSIEEALRVIDIAVSRAMMTRVEHDQAMKALRTIAQELKKEHKEE